MDRSALTLRLESASDCFHIRQFLATTQCPALFSSPTWSVSERASAAANSMRPGFASSTYQMRASRNRILALTLNSYTSNTIFDGSNRDGLSVFQPSLRARATRYVLARSRSLVVPASDHLDHRVKTMLDKLMAQETGAGAMAAALLKQVSSPCCAVRSDRAIRG